jgi:membrane protein
LKSSTSIRKLKFREILQVVKTAFVEFFKEQSFFHGAALAYYAVFALVPIIYLALISFGNIVGQATVMKMIDQLLKEQVGLQDSSGIMEFLKDAHFEKGNTLLNIVGICALLISSSALLSSLRNSINEFYDVEITIDDRKKRFEHHIGTKLISMLLLPVFGVILMMMYFGETFLLSASHTIFGNLNTTEQFLVATLLNVFTVLMNTLLFTVVLKYVQDGMVPWKLALGGGLITATMLFIGQLVIKYYLKNYFFGSKAGVAGTILVLLAWMYYTSQIIFLGAKFTKVYAERIGIPIQFKGRKVTTKKIVQKIAKVKK